MFHNGSRCSQPILYLKCNLSVSTQEKSEPGRCFRRWKSFQRSSSGCLCLTTHVPRFQPCCLWFFLAALHLPLAIPITAKGVQTSLWPDLLHLLSKYKQLYKGLKPWRKVPYVHLKPWRGSGHRIPMPVFQIQAYFNPWASWMTWRNSWESSCIWMHKLSWKLIGQEKLFKVCLHNAYTVYSCVFYH